MLFQIETLSGTWGSQSEVHCKAGWFTRESDGFSCAGVSAVLSVLVVKLRLLPGSDRTLSPHLPNKHLGKKYWREPRSSVLHDLISSFLSSVTNGYALTFCSGLCSSIDSFESYFKDCFVIGKLFIYEKQLSSEFQF